ncbi:flagellar protein FlaA [Yersinia intermedia]|nr:flagellar protein FlaA [Yersinia intermedia]
MISFSVWRELPISSLPVSEKSVTPAGKIKYKIKKDKIGSKIILQPVNILI